MALSLYQHGGDGSRVGALCAAIAVLRDRPRTADIWNKAHRSDVIWASRHQGSSEPTDPGRSWDDNGGTLAAGGGGGVNAAGVEERLDGTGNLRISPSAAARRPERHRGCRGGVGLKHATLRRIGGRRAGLLDRLLP